VGDRNASSDRRAHQFLAPENFRDQILLILDLRRGRKVLRERDEGISLSGIIEE